MPDECVSQFDHLSHEGGQGDFRGFSGLDHGLVSLSQIRVVTGGDERGHIQRIAQEFTSALDEGGATVAEDALSVRATMATAGLSGHWCQACEAGDLLACQGANFRTLDEDRDRSDPAQPRD